MEKEKSHRHSGRRMVRDGFMTHSRENPSILPSPAILESYEEVSPGIVDKLVEMVEKEQRYRQRLEDRRIGAARFSFAFGQFLSFVFGIATLAATLMLVNDGRSYMAAVVCVSAFAFLYVMSALAKSCKCDKSVTIDKNVEKKEQNSQEQHGMNKTMVHHNKTTTKGTVATDDKSHSQNLVENKGINERQKENNDRANDRHSGHRVPQGNKNERRDNRNKTESNRSKASITETRSPEAMEASEKIAHVITPDKNHGTCAREANGPHEEGNKAGERGNRGGSRESSSRRWR